MKLLISFILLTGCGVDCQYYSHGACVVEESKKYGPGKDYTDEMISHFVSFFPALSRGWAVEEEIKGALKNIGIWWVPHNSGFFNTHYTIYANSTTNVVNIKTSINPGYARRSSLWHEMVHAVEFYVYNTVDYHDKEKWKLDIEWVALAKLSQAWCKEHCCMDIGGHPNCEE